MKIDLGNIGTEFVQNFNLTKKVESRYIVESLAAEIKVTEKERFDYLIESTKAGDDREVGTLVIQCGDDEIEKEIFIKHNEGKIDLRNCIFTKSPQLKNVLDCVTEKEINIFNYAQSSTKTLEGTVNYINHNIAADYWATSSDDPNLYDINFLLNLVGGIPDKTSEGYHVYFNILSVEAKEGIIAYSGGIIPYKKYNGHLVHLAVIYVRLSSPTQINSNWKEIDGTYYFNNFKPVTFRNPKIEFDFLSFTIELSQEATPNLEWQAGSVRLFQDITISNTYEVNPIIQDVFSCTGLSVVSNWLDINADGTNPTNKYYDYAELNCKKLKIAQSFDIIRENKIRDSFGESGRLLVKDFIHDLCLIFNLNIIPDVENNIIRIEHISYFTRKGIDLTAKDYEISEVTINRDEIDSESFQMALMGGEASFFETKITYDRKDIYREPNEKIYKAKKILTDIFGMINNEDFNKPEYRQLFFLMSTNGDAISGLNEALNWNSLIQLHDMHRPMKTGKIDNQVITFNEMSLGFDLEVKIFGSIKLWNKLYPYNSVKLNQGTFMILETSYKDDELLTLKCIK